MLCPSCGATNSQSARWCTLCFKVLVRPEAISSADGGRAYEGVPNPTGTVASAASFGAPVSPRSSGITIPNSPEASPVPPPPTSGRTASLGITVESPGVLTWECRRCQTRNEIETIDCPVCGWSLFQPLKEQRSGPKSLDPASVRWWSLIPGGGQWVLGLKGQAVARCALVGWLLVLSMLLSDALVRWAQLLFIVAGLSVWAVSAFDADRAARSEDNQILGGRRLALAFVVSLVMVFSVSFVIGFTVAGSNRDRGYLNEGKDPGGGGVVHEPAVGESVDPPVGGSSGNGEAVS